MVDAMPGCAWGWLRPSQADASRAAQAGGLGKREAAEPAPCLSHQPDVRRCGINHLAPLRHAEVVARRVAEAGVDAVGLLRRLLRELDAAALELLIALPDVV